MLKVEEFCNFFPFFPIENLTGFSNETLKNLKFLDSQFFKHVLNIKIYVH